MSSTWLLVANNDNQTFTAKTTIADPSLIYRAVTKWLIRGGASEILKEYWEYIDQYDNELEDALLDQLVTQAETNPEDPQITNVRTKDYAIDMSVHAQTANKTYKRCSITCTLFVYFKSLKKKLRIEDKTIDLTMFKATDIETVSVETAYKTPAHHLKANKRVSKRSSKSNNIVG